MKPVHARALTVTGLQEQLAVLWIGGRTGGKGNCRIAFREYWSHLTEDTLSATLRRASVGRANAGCPPKRVSAKAGLLLAVYGPDTSVTVRTYLRHR